VWDLRAVAHPSYVFVARPRIVMMEGDGSPGSTAYQRNLRPSPLLPVSLFAEPNLR
jgi:hypothetical protein